jgi:tetratricopeptide (TPR) repeat protein
MYFENMPRNFPKSIENVPLEDIRIAGIVLAADLVLKKKYTEAKKVFEKILEISPNNANIMSLLANVCIMEGTYSEAERWLDKVLLLEPKHSQGLYHMGVVYHEKGKFEKAIEMYQEAIENFPKNKRQDIAEAFQNLGCSLWEVRRREDALEAWKMCLKYNPKQRYAKKNLKEFMNEYGMPSAPMFDDYYAFTDIKNKEYLASQGKKDFDNIKEANFVLHKSMDAWNNLILPKYGAKLDRMKTQDKVKLFKDTKVFD